MARHLHACGCALGAAAAIAFAWPLLGNSPLGEGLPRLAGAALAQDAALPGLDFDVYASGCLGELEDGKAIHFPATLQCADGPILPITFDGAPIPADTPADAKHFTSATTCDKPPLLDISGGKIGQCVPNSRLQVRKVRQDGVTEEKDWPRYALLCRNYVFRSLEDEEKTPEYDDVAMIVYSPLNRKTCFFQRLANTALFFEPVEDRRFGAVAAISGVDIPSPFGSEGKNFWADPDVVESINCARCHDANPFVRSPYVFQVAKGADALPPRTPGEAYGIAWLDHFGAEWKKHHAYFDLRPTGHGEPGACVSCHSLGAGRTSGAFTEWSAGALAPGQHDTGKFADTHWMPPGANQSNWEARYKASVEALLRCNASPSDTGCNKTDLH